MGRRLARIITIALLVVIVGLSLAGRLPMPTCLKRLTYGVKPGVIMEGRDISGMLEMELREWLEDENRLYAIAPVNASPDDLLRLDVQGVIPGRFGRMIDLDKTVQLALGARRSTTLSYVIKEVAPQMTADCYPERVIYRGNPARQEMALAINVAWGNENLDDILQVLSRHQTPATFFLVGRWVDAFPGDAKQLAQAGHEMANHGYSDPHMKRLTKEKIINEIKDTDRAIRNATGQSPRLFSPPYLELNDLVVQSARELDYRVVMVHVDTADWTRPGVQKIADRVTKSASSGAIVLAHPTEQT
ncbi:MAG: polysaccharide deacetylase family protein, partial [Bacillota bacterium]